LTKPQPLNNIVRTALQALSAVLGGAQSLHANGLDEAYTIPSEQAMKVALRTQQIIAEETRIPNVVDPLGGSYYVEALTNQIEAAVFAILKEIDDLGGTVRAIEEGYFQRAIADAAYEDAKAKGSGTEVVVGVNKYVDPPTPAEIEVHRTDPDAEARQVARLRDARARRDNERVEQLLDRVAREAQQPSANLMPTTIELVKAQATMGEIVQRLKTVFGSYVEPPVF
jgi:methylmalonyl-CoA mutase N-terminal domain/subunit